MAEEKRKKSCFRRCCTALLITFLVIFVLLAAGCAVGLVFADKFLKENYDVSVNDCWHVVTGLFDAKEKKIVSDPVSDGDQDEMYSSLKKVLFLGESADLEGVVNGYLDETINGKGDAGKSTTPASYASGSDENELMNKIADLYADGNLDVKRLRSYIENNVDISAVYDADFTVTIKGNGFCKTVEKIVRAQLKKQSETAQIADKVHVREISFGKIDGSARIRIVLKLDTKSAGGEILSGQVNGMPPFVLSMAKQAIPAATYATADLVLSSPAKLNIRINSMSDTTMAAIYKIINKTSSSGDGSPTDVQAQLDKSAEEIAVSLRKDAPQLLSVLESVGDNGKINLDAYGMIADELNKDKSDEKKISGRELATLLVGVLGSDEKKAIEQRIAADPRYGEDDWSGKYAANLVEAMADSFSLANSYFVNGTDENGNKILSVENGIIVGTDKLIGRVYEGADGNLYYKKSGGQFKIYISGNQVSRFYRDGFDEYYSLGLHYTSGADDYTLYRSADKTTIYGVSGEKLQLKNGTYTELTKLYVDADGNVYSSPNAKPGLIEISKDLLTVDTVQNLLYGNDVDTNKILDLIDFGSLRINGVQSWLEPLSISDIQIAAMTDSVIADYLGEDIKKADPHVAYAKIHTDGSSAYITLGITLKLSALVDESMSRLTENLIGDIVYAEVTCDITLGKKEGEFSKTVIRYNDLGGEYTDKVLGILGKLSENLDVTGQLENAAREIRKAISSINDAVKINIVDGAVKTDSPAAIIIPLITDGNVTEDEFITAIDMLFKSDSGAAIAAEKNSRPEFAGENWITTGVNSFVVSFCEAFILDKQKFMSADGINYSLDKIIELAGKGTVTLSDVQPYLDYETMKNDGFVSWKEGFSASDLQMASLVNYYLDDCFASLGADPRIESMHVYENDGKEMLSVAVSLKTDALLGGNATLSRILGALDEKIYAVISVDVTANATSYEKSALRFNDLNEAQTQTLLGVLAKINPDFSEEKLFGGVENELRSVLGEVRNGLNFRFGNGAVTFDAPVNIIYNSVMPSVDPDFTPSDLADALTKLTTSGNGYYEENNGFVADTSRDEKHKLFWNDTLKNKYFLRTDINTLFAALTGGGSVYDAVLDGMDKTLFTKADGSYAHTTIDDASYKAYSDELSWLLRANSSALSSLGGGNLMAKLSVYSATVTEENGKAKVTVIAFMPTEDIIAETGSLEDGIKEIIQNILPDKTAIEISWTEVGSVNLSFMGMSTDDMSLVDALIEKLGNVSLFGENSDMEKAALSVKDCFDDNFIVGIEDGKGYVCMPDFYELIRRNVFSPNKPGKEQVSRGDVYALFKTLYERPETNGVFDSAIVGYENKPEDVEKISRYVHDDSYILVGATETLEISIDNPQAKLKATVLYVPALGGDAKKVLPENLYITLDYDAHPVVSGMNVNIDGSEISAMFNKGENQAELKRCLDYLGVDTDTAVNSAKVQLDNYIKSMLP